MLCHCDGLEGPETPPGLGERGARLIGFSCNTNESHHACCGGAECQDVLANTGNCIEESSAFPITEDEDKQVMSTRHVLSLGNTAEESFAFTTVAD